MSSSYADVVLALLTPPPAATPAEGLARADAPLDRGVPHRLRLDADHELVLLVPTGVAVDWRDADPDEPVSAAADDRAPRAEDDPAVGALRRPPARLALLERGAVTAVAPLVAGPPRRWARIELQAVHWDLRAGALRGPGDGISRIALAWRRADKAPEAFAPPPVPERVTARHPPAERVQSSLGTRQDAFPWSKGHT